MLKRCNTCGGEYEDRGADGMLYFHVCPPITRVRVKRDGEAQTVDLADLRDTDLVRVLRNNEPIETLHREIQPGDQRLGDVTRERPQARDENSAVIGGDEEDDDRMPKRRRRLKARGRGATDLPPKAPNAA